ncbi:unnamed protein product [Pleuronectes platessa]|uniref:Uncharacterized protein n=1 Tax=Pleuronectes platessa TaxID=8262 RepID=A0A9N7VEL0_PLEPL|nr:unnamed protein product [Pleuronectes platessa]
MKSVLLPEFILYDSTLSHEAYEQPWHQAWGCSRAISPINPIPNLMTTALDCGESPGYPEITCTDTGGTCKIHKPQLNLDGPVERWRDSPLIQNAQFSGPK